MDPFSAEGELLNINNAFNQGQYQNVIDFDISAFATENALAARVLQLRAQIASGQSDEVLAEVEGEDDVPDLAAVKALAQYAAGNASEAIKGAEALIAVASSNSTVQILGGTILQAAGKSEEALSLLSKHQGNLEAVALIVQIHLQQNRTESAMKEVQAARKWGQDSLLVNIAESWVGLRVGGGEKYQQAFYEFEAMAQAPSNLASKGLTCQAVAEIHLGRLPEAEAALQQALKNDPKDAEAIVNSIVLDFISGKENLDLVKSLHSISPEHIHLTDLKEKSALFDQAATKYSAKVAS